MKDEGLVVAGFHHFVRFEDVVVLVWVPPGDEVVMHVLVHQEHYRPPRPQSHDLWHYPLVKRQEPAKVNHPPDGGHLPFLPVHSCDHPGGSPVDILPHRLGSLHKNYSQMQGHQSPGFLTWPHQRECWHSSQGCLPSDLFQPGKCDFRRTFSQNASPCAKTQVCSLGSLAPSSSQCDRNQSTPGIASIYSYKPSFTMLKYPFLAIVPVMPFPSSPFRPNPSSLTISLATLLEQAIEKMLEPLEFYQVDGTMDWCALLDCNLTCMKILSCRKTTLELFPTFTTSKGLTMMASVTPAPSPAREYVWKWQDFVHLQFCAGYQRSWLLCPKAEDLLELLKSEELWHER